MKKIISLPKTYKESLIEKTDGVLLGIKDLSIGFSIYETKESLIEKIKYLKTLNKEVFISLNKNIYNEDLEYLKEIINTISEYEIDGLLYYDLSIYNIVKDQNLNIPLYWNQEHLTTNSNTCNFWYKRGVSGAVLSNDITIDEIIEIRKKTPIKLIVKIYGYVKMMASSRKLITNYLKYINEPKDSKKYEIYEKISSKKYPILEDEHGTITLTDKEINGIKHINKLEKSNIDYIFLDGINQDNFEEIIDAFNQNNIDYFKDIEEYFFTKNTIYKVKK